MPLDVTVAARSGTTAADLLGAVRDYAIEKAGNPWLLASRRPLVLRHASPRAEGVAYTFTRVDATSARLRLTGKRARLGLAYAVTLLANKRLADYVERVTIGIPPDS